MRELFWAIVIIGAILALAIMKVVEKIDDLRRDIRNAGEGNDLANLSLQLKVLNLEIMQISTWLRKDGNSEAIERFVEKRRLELQEEESP